METRTTNSEIKKVSSSQDRRKCGKFKIGDKVDFVNDSGVISRDRIVTNIELIDEEYRYLVEPTDTPWFLDYEKNLHLAGTYKPESLNLSLNNGTIAKFSYCDDMGRKVYEIEYNSSLYNVVLLEECNMLYTINSSYGVDEPDSPLKKQLQPKNEGETA